jgi:queuine/archaeosine tRNA-ribosyltransferase
MQLLSLHNVHFLIHLLRGLRTAVFEDRIEEYSRDFFTNYFRDEPEGVPLWIKNALAACEMEL